MQGTCREHAGNIQETFREHSGNIQGTFREHSGNIQEIREHSHSVGENLDIVVGGELVDIRVNWQMFVFHGISF
jgi:hypothetical protein